MNDDHETGPTLANCRAWCVSFLEGVADFLQSQAGVNRREFKYRANPGELYRVTFDHRGVIRVTEWATGRHVVTSLPGQPTAPDMRACAPVHRVGPPDLSFPRGWA